MDLFTRYKLKGLDIKNRLVMPPLVIFNIAKDNKATDENVEHYRKRAKGGVGLIIVEATCISEHARLSDGQLGIWYDSQIEGLKNIANASHEYDTPILIQLHHAGLKTVGSGEKVSASDFDGENKGKKVHARELSVEEIDIIRQQFVNAAIRAKKAGFDGVEIHGAHGYLISQFLSPAVNKREDRYGGSTENRARLASEVICDIRKELGEDFIIGIRMGGNDPSLSECIKYAQIFEKAGADILHVSHGFETAAPCDMIMIDDDYSFIVNCGLNIRKHVSIPVIAVTGIDTVKKASVLIEKDLIDFVAMGKALLADEDIANKAKDNIPINKCLHCNPCRWYEDGKKCPAQMMKK